MGSYNVCEKPVKDLTETEVREEAAELRIQITLIEGELSKRCAWEKAENRDTGERHLRWLANTRSLRTKLTSRYAAIRPREKEINRRKHSGKRMEVAAGSS